MDALKMFTRRDLMRYGAAAAGVAALPGVSHATTAKKPRKLVQIFLGTGIDTLFTFDPKKPGECPQGVDPCYPEDQMVHAGSVRVGPMLAGWSSYLDRMQIINGVLCNTVSHEVGYNQITQMRRKAALAGDRTFLNWVGSVLDPSAPMFDVRLHRSPMSTWIPPYGRTLFLTDLRMLESPTKDPARYGMLLSALKKRGALSTNSLESSYFDASLRWFERIEGLKFPALPEPLKPRIANEPEGLSAQLDPIERGLIGDLEAALFILRHDLAPTVSISANLGWDTHTDNHPKQAAAIARLVPWIKYLLDQLALPGPDGRALIDDTAILMLSELGRFPYLNVAQGKDHFPAFTAVMMGPQLARGQFGRTNGELEPQPISLRTGTPVGPEQKRVTLDDLGRTILEWVGMNDPEAKGYRGDVMKFCFA